jgi:hypothetical protein
MEQNPRHASKINLGSTIVHQSIHLISTDATSETTLIIDVENPYPLEEDKGGREKMGKNIPHTGEGHSYTQPQSHPQLVGVELPFTIPIALLLSQHIENEKKREMKRKAPSVHGVHWYAYLHLPFACGSNTNIYYACV